MQSFARGLIPVILIFVANALVSEAAAQACDVDADGDVDTIDVGLILAARNMPADGPDDPRDADGDGVITVLDARLCVARCTLPRCAEPQPNQAPLITSVPVTTATAGELYSYDVEASDPDGDTLTFSLDVAPTGMSIDPATGLVQWTPDNAQLGTNVVAVRASDPNGAFATQSYTVLVESGNRAPLITSVPVTSATAGQLYTYDVEADDPDGDTLTFSLDVAPTGMSIDPASGLVQWTPDNAQLGTNVVAVRASDPNGAFATQSYTIAVDAGQDFLRPQVELVFAPGNVIDVGTTVTIQVITTDNVGVTDTTLAINGAGVPLDVSGIGAFGSSAPGVFNVIATAVDAAGNQGTATALLRVLEPGNTVPPTVAIVSPAVDSTVISPIDIIGTADDDNALLFYEIELAPAGTNRFVSVDSGNTAVVNGVLGQLDPTLMMNGLYDLRLRVEDASGNTASVSTTITIDRNLKFGEYALTLTDLELPAPGLPVRIDRTYDNRRQGSGDFGFGWELDVSDVTIGESRALGIGWEITSSGGFFPDFCIQPAGTPPRVVVTYPDGSLDTFLARAVVAGTSSECQLLIPPQFVDIVLVPLDNDRSAQAAGGTSLLVSGGNLLDSSFFGVYDPGRYFLTLEDGTQLQVAQPTGLQQVTDRNGNVLTIGPGGIIHSSGRSVSFGRDGNGRITSITDPLGNEITYEYDFYGDLVASTDQEGNTTRYRYDNSHGLLEIIRPLGDTAVRNEYDADGRLIASEDDGGNRDIYAYDIPVRQETVTDSLGNTTVLVYDGAGNLLSLTDSLGSTSSFTYDADGNQLSATDALGNTSTFTYDARGNLISETDPLGNTTSYTYDARNNLLTRIDPLGNVSSFSYDANGNRVTETDESGATTTYTYDAMGNVLTTTDPLGNTTTFTYEATGDLASATDPLGDVTTYTYDLNGNQLTETQNRTLPGGGTETLLTTRTYDRMNRLVRVVDPSGNVTEIVYDANGNVVPNP